LNSSTTVPLFHPEDSDRLRDFYEEQGLAVLNADGVINCSEKPNTEIVLRMMRERIDDFQTVLDVGCGANLVVDQAIADQGRKVVGADFAWTFLKLAPANSSIQLVQADACKLPFRDGAYDAVVCSETLEHIPDDRAVVEEIARLLRPRGWLFFTVPNLWNAHRIIAMIKKLRLRIDLMPGHLREYSLREVKDLLEPRFEIDRIYPVGFGWAGSPFGGSIEWLIEHRVLARLTKSVALAARKR
jgi:SAM-dependent methyltransferase